MQVREVTVAVVLCLTLGFLPAAAQKSPGPSTTQTAKPPGAASSVPPAPQVKPQAEPQDKIDSAKEADILRLLDISGAKGLAQQIMDNMQANVKPVLTNSLPPGDYRDKLIDLFLAKLRAKADPQQIVALTVPIYDKHLSHEDIKGLIQFYQTPLGKKTLSVLPMILLESQQAGQKWGETLGSECMREVITEHPELAQAMESAAKSQR